MKNYEIYTIGYEGRGIEDFITRLKSFNITRLIDVREIPLSRKKGFSKLGLSERLEGENIEYIHFKSLGSPSDIRDKLRTDGNYESFFKAYSKYLAKNMDAVAEIHGYIAHGVNCLMCFERLPTKCHRLAVVKKIKEYDGNGLKITHI
jgi:uncharacterized protein (DUF488 family)